MASVEKIGHRSLGFGFWKAATRAPSAWVLALACSAGCTLFYGGELDKKQCKSDADCDSTAALLGGPLECRQEACQPPTCAQTTDCPAGSVCESELCVAESDAGTNKVACTQDDDCEGGELRCGYDGFCYEKWGCLAESKTWPNTPFNLTYTTSLVRAEAPSDPSAVRDIQVEVCALTDPGCERALVEPDEVTIGADATVTVPLVNGSSSTSFVGFVRFTSPPSEGGGEGDIMPVYRHFTSESPLVSDMVDPIEITVLSAQLMSLLSENLGVSLDLEAGIIQLFVSDCGGRAAAGVSVGVPTAPDSTFFALSGSGPIVGSNQTTEDGSGTVINLPPRLHTLVLSDESQQLTITSSLSVSVQGGARGYVIYYPRNSALQAWLAEAARRGLVTPE